MPYQVTAPPFFPRTPDKPLVSVLIPTRTRANCRLDKVISSLFDNVMEANDIEVILKIDDDDHEMQETASHLVLQHKQIKTVTVPYGQGYVDMTRYLNAMLGVARGDWLFLLGDNTTVATKYWDMHLNYMVPVNPWVGIEDSLMLFPNIYGFMFIRKKTVEVMGGFPGWDLPLRAIMEGIRCVTGISVVIEHETTPEGILDKDEEIKRLGIQCSEYTSARKRYLHGLANEILNHLQMRESTAQWLVEPKEGWNIYRSPEGVMVSCHAHYMNEGCYFSCPQAAALNRIMKGGGEFLPMEIAK